MKPQVNNDYYNDLKNDDWYSRDDTPIALLRAEQDIKNPWVTKTIKKYFPNKDLKVLDLGCGAGFLTNHLIHHFNYVEGIDQSAPSLEIAKQNDPTQKVVYKLGNAYSLESENEKYDVVCAMDFLEHVDEPEKVIKECSRVLKNGGLFFFHTFNRNILSWLIIIKLVEWFVPNTPKNLHVLHLFIKPKELKTMMAINQLKSETCLGIRPSFDKHFFKSAIKRRMTKGFSFKIGGGLLLGYLGVAKKVSKSVLKV